MDLNQLVGTAKKFIKANGPLISSVAAGVGTVTTAYLTFRATYKAAEVIRTHEVDNVPPVNPRKRFWHRTLLVWKLYVPAAISGTSTLLSIAAANRLSAKQTAAAVGALAVTQRNLVEYRSKATELLGKRKDQSIQDQVVAERVKAIPPPSQDALVIGTGDVLCCELHTMRYFVCNMEKLRRAENRLNAELLKQDYATMSQFYYEVGLKQTSVSSNQGWTSDHLLELIFTSTLTDDGRPCIAFDYNYVHPV